MHVSTYGSHGIDKALPCCHGGMPEVAERLVICLRLESQGTGHTTENTLIVNALLPGETHPVILRFPTPPALASQKL